MPLYNSYSILADGGTAYRSIQDRFGDVLNAFDFQNIVGDGSNDDAPGLRAAITAASSAGKPLFLPVPPVRYRLATASSGILLPLPANFILLGSFGEMRNEATDAHGIVGDEGADNIYIEGIYFNHRAQSYEDINTHGETDLALFSTNSRYSTASGGTVRHAVWFRGLNCTARRNKIERSQTSSIRFSGGASGAAIDNLIIEPRLNGINPSTDSADVLVSNNRILDTMFIGIAVFSVDESTSSRHIVIGNQVINTNGYGETGIEYAGTTTHVIGGVVANNTISGFGLTGARALFADDGIFTGNKIADIGLSAAQQAVWIGASQRSGIVLNDSERWLVCGNRINNTDNFGIFSETEAAAVFGNYITNTVDEEFKITGESAWDGFAAWDMAPGAMLVRGGARTFKDNVILKADLDTSAITNSRQASAGLKATHFLAGSAQAASHTGDTNETTLATITIPAGAMGANGFIEVDALWTFTDSANAKTMRGRLGGISGTAYLSVANSTAGQVSVRTTTRVYNRNSQSSQIGTLATSGNPFTASTSAWPTSSVDTSASTTFVLTAQLASAGETITLQAYSARINYAV
jgi:hypothetical protein